MNFLLLSTLVLIVAVAVSFGVAELVTRPWVAERTTTLSAGLLGVAICALMAFGMLFALDPDPVFGADDLLSRLRRTAPLTGLSAILWLPIFMVVYTVRRRRVDGVRQ